MKSESQSHSRSVKGSNSMRNTNNKNVAKIEEPKKVPERLSSKDTKPDSKEADN